MNVFELAAKITVDSSEYNKGLKDAAAEGKSTFAKISGYAGKITKSVGTFAGAAITAASGAVVAMGKSAISGYAQYEQLIGGIEKLYDKSAKELIDYANRAYEGYGISANEYMQTVTTFSASLIKSLKGDTHAAVIMADTAMKDMADNANVFGTDMERIQAAYAAFAKQNYTLLDNLNLGFAPTKQGMKDLIAEANKIRKSQGLKGLLSIENYSDIVEAIHIIQKEMGIYGKSQEEAARTIEGSYKTMKAAWQNYVAAMADQNEYRTISAYNLAEAVGKYWDNLGPAIARFSKGFSDFILYISPLIKTKLPKMIESTLPDIVKGASRLIVALGKTLPKIAPTLLKEGINGIISVINGLLGTNIPEIKEIKFPSPAELFKMGHEMWIAIKKGVSDAGDWLAGVILPGTKINPGSGWKTLGQAIWNAIKEGITSIPEKFMNLGDEIARALFTDSEWEVIDEGTGWARIGKAIVDGIKSGIDAAGDWLASVLLPNVQFDENAGWKTIGENIWTLISSGFHAATGFLYNILVGEGEADLSDSAMWEGIGNAILSGITTAFTATTDFLYSLIVGSGDTADNESKKWEGIGNAIIAGITDAFSSATDWLYGIIVGGETPATNPEKWTAIGEAILNGIKEGINVAGDWLADIIFPNTRINEGGGWAAIGSQIWPAITSGINAAGDWLASIILPGTKINEGGGWSAIGNAIWSAILSGINAVGDWLADLIFPNTRVNEGGGWAAIGSQIWPAILSGISVAGDWLASIILPGTKIDEGGGWKALGGAIWPAIVSGITVAGDWLASIILPGTKINEGGGWTAIGNAIWPAIVSGINVVGDWLADIIFPNTRVNEGGGWSAIGAQIWPAIVSGISVVGDWLADLIFPNTRINEGGGWTAIGSQIWPAIEKGIVVAADWLYTLIVGEGDENLTSAEKWGKVGTAIKDGVQNAFATGTDFLYKLIVGEGKDDLTTPEKWSRIGEAIFQGIESVSVDFDEFVKKLILGEGKYKQGESTWKDVGKQFADWLIEAFEEANEGENGKSYFQSMLDDVIMGLGELAEGFFGRIFESFFEELRQEWNDFADLINNALGVNLLPKILNEQEMQQAVSEMATAYKEAFSEFSDDQISFINEYETNIAKAKQLIAERDYAINKNDQKEIDRLNDELTALYERNEVLQALMEGTKNGEGKSLWELFQEYRQKVQVEPVLVGDSQASLQSELDKLELNGTVHLHFETDNGGFGTGSGGSFGGSINYGSSGGGSDRYPLQHEAKGINYVPTNDFLARLHKGETVLSANDAREYRAGLSGSMNTELIADAVRGAITEAMGNMAFVMNGRQVVNAISGPMSRNVSGFQRADLAGYGR